MISWALVLETAVKWLIPAICVAIVGLVTAHFIKPFKKGNAAKQQEEWDEHFKVSQEPKKMGDHEQGLLETKLSHQVMEADQKIMEKIDKLSTSIDEQNLTNKAYHEKVDKSINLIQEGVRDAHLQNLIATCEQYIRRGYITSTELDVYQSRYKLYKELGGNGHMEPWDAKIKALPNEPPKPPTPVNKNNPVVQLPLPKTHV